MKYKKATDLTLKGENEAHLLREHENGTIHSLVVTTDKKNTHITIDNDIDLASPSELDKILGESTNVDNLFIDNVVYDTSNDIYTQRVNFRGESFTEIDVSLVNEGDAETTYSYQISYEETKYR